MSDRPIIFSGAMVRALLDGRKTQTRRLATSPLRRCEAGDRLYVREALWIVGDGIRYGEPANDYLFDPDDFATLHAYDAARELWVRKVRDGVRAIGIPSIHMPRWASRLTLIVEGVKAERLNNISEGDAVAEGVQPVNDPRGPAWKSYETLPNGKPHPHASVPNASPVTSFRELWNSLHAAEGERWQDNPEIVALTFRVERGNIDRIGSAG
jgi:hypothetical protein